MRSVAVYLTQRLYGGPEEGGWWYDAGELCTDPVLCGTGQAILDDITRCGLNPTGPRAAPSMVTSAPDDT